MIIEHLINRFCRHSDQQRATKGKIIDFKDNIINLNGKSCFQGELNLIKEKIQSIYLISLLIFISTMRMEPFFL